MDLTTQTLGTQRERRGFFAFAMLGLATLSGATGMALAGPAEDLAAADPQRVEAMTKKCAKCHGPDGVSDDPEMPHLAGQRADYMYKQLHDFKADAREGGKMNKTASKLSEQEMADLAVLFGEKSLPEEDGVSMPAAPALVSTGDAGRGIDACADCHGDDGRGKKDKYTAPALAGMPLVFFEATLQAFRSGERTNDEDGVMQKAAKGLSDAEIKTLADYYLALGKRHPLPPL